MGGVCKSPTRLAEFTREKVLHDELFIPLAKISPFSVKIKRVIRVTLVTRLYVLPW